MQIYSFSSGIANTSPIIISARTLPSLPLFAQQAAFLTVLTTCFGVNFILGGMHGCAQPQTKEKTRSAVVHFGSDLYLRRRFLRTDQPKWPSDLPSAKYSPWE